MFPNWSKVSWRCGVQKPSNIKLLSGEARRRELLILPAKDRSIANGRAAIG